MKLSVNILCAEAVRRGFTVCVSVCEKQMDLEEDLSLCATLNIITEKQHNYSNYNPPTQKQLNSNNIFIYADSLLSHHFLSTLDSRLIQAFF